MNNIIKVNNIYNMNCIDGLKLMSNNQVDITITSPPYNVGKDVAGKGKYNNYNDNMSEDDYYNFIKQTINELIRVTKYYSFFNFQILSNNKNVYLKLMSEYKDNIKDIIIWHKKQCTPAMNPTCLSSSFEFIIVITKKELANRRTFERAFFNNRIVGEWEKNVIYGNSNSVPEFNDGKTGNNACFPQYFVKWFIDNFTQEGDIILDPFMGSGTTAYVCKQNKRNYIGFEIDKEQIECSLSKLNQKNLLDSYNSEPIVEEIINLKNFEDG